MIRRSHFLPVGILVLAPISLSACGGKKSGDTASNDSGTQSDTGATRGPMSGTDSGTAGPSIYAIQQGEIPIGEQVTLENVIVSSPRTAFGFFIEEPEGGAYSGLWVYDSGVVGNAIAQGDQITITGEVFEYSSAPNAVDDGTLTELIVNTADDVVVTGTAAVPDPVSVSVSDLDPSNAEKYEGVLVEISGTLTVTDTGLDGDVFEVNNGVYVGDLFGLGASPNVNDTYTTIRGPLYYSYGQYKIEPRDESDLEGYTRYCGGDKCAGDLGAGDLVVTELMPNPDNGGACPDSEGEYIEVYNSTSGTVDMGGVQLVDASGNTGEVEGSVVVAAGAYAVLAPSSSGTFCYGTPEGYYNSGVSLNNGGDSITLLNPDDGTTIDEVTYSDSTKGTAIGFDGSMTPDATANDDEGNWCDQTSTIGRTTDHGTPGAPNDTCGG